jgi:hypothetical protein
VIAEWGGREHGLYLGVLRLWPLGSCCGAASQTQLSSGQLGACSRSASASSSALVIRAQRSLTYAKLDLLLLKVDVHVLHVGVADHAVLDTLMFASEAVRGSRVQNVMLGGARWAEPG